MNKYFLLSATTLAFTTLAAVGSESSKYSYKPKEGYVPNEATAIKIAVAVWEPIYKNIANEKPYNASLSNGVWTVTSSIPRGGVGGVAIAEIAKEDGKILRVSHGK